MNKKVFSLLFFLSGLCGLMYQILWTRMFSFVLGNTYLTISIIVASFMFGLFLGSYLIGRYIDKVHHELKWYALLEVLIGGYALLLLLSFGFTDSIFKWLNLFLNRIEIIYSLSKFVVTLFFIIIPTSAMGATLPLVVQYYTKNKKLFGDNVSLFYGINTIGGAVGALFAGFYLIEHLGISNGLLFTAAINILIGFIVFSASKRSEIQTLDVALEKNPDKKKRKERKKLPGKPSVEGFKILYLAAAGLAGFAALSYEIIWTRGLKFLIHNSTYSFSVMLFVFLLGIAIGSHVAKKINGKKRDLHYTYGILQLILGVFAVFTIYLLYRFSYSGFFQRNVVEIIYDYSYTWQWGIIIYVLICSIMFLIPTVIMGILFPLINQLYFKNIIDKAGKTVSSIYAVNTIGSIMGSLVAGFFLIPAFGIKTSIIIISIINLFLGILFVFKSYFKIQSTLLAGSVLFVFVTSLSYNGKYLFGRGENKQSRVLFYQEGLMSTVKVFERQNNFFISIDGNTIASTHRTLFKKEKLIAHLPFFIKPGIKKVLSVGLASGISAGAMSLHQNIEQIDCVELIKPVFAAAKYFTNYNNNILKNPRTNLIYNDIYAYLRQQNEKYDLISSDGKLGPLYSGNTIMLSRDYYELCKQRMKKDGVFIQWIPIITPYKELKVIFDTLQSSFRYVFVFYFYPADIFMLASESPIILDKSYMDNVFSNTAVRQDLEQFGIKDALSILSSFIGVYEIVSHEDIRINSFDKPILEFEYMREWKKSKMWAGGYRAKNLQFLVENYEKTELDDLYALVNHVEKPDLKNIVMGARLFFKGCIKFYKTGNFQNSFREYYKFRQSKS